MAVIITKQKDIEAYYEDPSINQSLLKDLQDGLAGLKAAAAKKQKREEENKPEPDYFLYGGGVDTILTGEKGQYENQYHISTLESTPSDAEVLIIKQVFDELVANEVEIDMSLDQYRSMLDIAIKDQQWYKGNPGEKRIAGLIERGAPYFEDLKKSLGKKVIGGNIDFTIQAIVKSLRENPRTSKYFDRETQTLIDNVDFYYQLPIYWEMHGVKCKALLDMVIVVKDSYGHIMTIEPIDLKTMSGETLNFPTQLRVHRYDIQAAWYTKALLNHFEVEEDIIKPFKFIVESTTNIGTPLVYELNAETLLHGTWGSPAGILETEGGRQMYLKQIKGWFQFLKEYIFYMENEFREDIIIDNNPGTLVVDWTTGIQNVSRS